MNGWPFIDWLVVSTTVYDDSRSRPDASPAGDDGDLHRHCSAARANTGHLVVDLIEKMQQTQGDVCPQLTPEKAKTSEGEKLHLDEKTFRWMHNEDAMATDKLAEGIRKFYADARKLEQYAHSQVREKVTA